MKIFIVLTLLAATCSGEFLEIEKFLISPDFLFENAWSYQEFLSVLQDDIDETIHEVQTAISSVLESGTGSALKLHEGHISDLLAKRAPLVDDFGRLNSGECRNLAQSLLDMVTSQTGFGASNCMKHYNNAVDIEISKAAALIANFDSLYAQVQQIVVKSFIGKNALVTPEAISDTMIAVYEFVEKKWNDSKPEVESVKAALRAGIADQDTQLALCNSVNINNSQSGFGFLENQIATCTEFDASAKSGRGSRAQTFINYVPQYEAALEKITEYEWQ